MNDIIVDIDPETEEELTPEQDMKGWRPILDSEGLLVLPVASSLGSAFKKSAGNPPKLSEMSPEERMSYLQAPSKVDPMGERITKAVHLSELPHEARAGVFLRVKTALAGLSL